jgi:hypothetical protein
VPLCSLEARFPGIGTEQLIEFDEDDDDDGDDDGDVTGLYRLIGTA